MPKAIHLDHAVLMLIAMLDQYGVPRIREYDLHCLVCSLAPRWWPGLRFITRPTVYSPALHGCLHELERRGSVNELILLHNGWVPRHEYELTRIGKIRAKDLIERLRIFGGTAVDELDRTARFRASGLSQHHREEDRSYPTHYR